MRAAALVLALALLAGAGGRAVAEELAAPYVAQSLGSAKHRVGLDALGLGLGAPWEERPTGRGVRIGLLDTGLDPAHPDLRDALACATCWADFTGAARPPLAAGPYDDHGHGTHVAGILVARGHAQLDPLGAYWLTGARGVAPGATLLVAKAMDHRGEGADDRVAAALAWVLDPDGDPRTDDGADVINLSIGIAPPKDGQGATLGAATREAIRRAIGKGVPVVVSSGNDGAATLRAPGDEAGVIAVAAVDPSGRLAAFSNHGDGLDLLAPGVLVSTYPRALDRLDLAQDGYAAMAGTSMAAPVVAGAIALLMEAQPALEPHPGKPGDRSGDVARIEALLKRTAAPSPEAPGGAGVLDVEAALLAARGPAPLDAGGLAASLAAVAGAAILGGGWAARVRSRRRAAAPVPAPAPAAGLAARAPPPLPALAAAPPGPLPAPLPARVVRKPSAPPPRPRARRPCS